MEWRREKRRDIVLVVLANVCVSVSPGTVHWCAQLTESKFGICVSLLGGARASRMLSDNTQLPSPRTGNSLLFQIYTTVSAPVAYRQTLSPQLYN